jgi:transketolase N-terminal domain/subunit
MKKRHPGRRRFYLIRRPVGCIHASQAMAEVFATLYRSLLKCDPQLAEDFRRDPFGLKDGKETASAS